MPTESNYDSEALHNGKRRPLLIGCSGGGGHNTAIKGIAGFLEKKYPDTIEFPQHQSELFEKKLASPADEQLAYRTKVKIRAGASIVHAALVGLPIRTVVNQTGYPVLPDIKEIEAEARKLSIDEKRRYIDMLLDVYPAGYYSAAIWNVLQRADEVEQLKKLIDLQEMSDTENHDTVKKFYFDKLKEAVDQSEPYTEIISTQAMALPALCDAVIEYNTWLNENNMVNTPRVVIHQYLTDLPTKGAVHFFNSLSKLKKEQQEQMKLYGVGMSDYIMHHFKANNFAGVYNIPPKENPMVRPGFKDPDKDNSKNFDKEITITLKDYKYQKVEEKGVVVEKWTSNGEAKYNIKSGEKVASVMLGSQAGADTTEYIVPLLESGVDKIFVFGGLQNSAILERIKRIQQDPRYSGKIIPLGNQDDEHIAALMSRSNVVITRGGGLSVMEQMAMNHHPEQTVLIHHANSTAEHLSSGISWEDENVNALMDDLNKRGVNATKTSPNRVRRHLVEAEFIRAVKASGDEGIDAQVKFIRKLPEHRLMFFVDALRKKNSVREWQSYYNESQTKAGSIVTSLSDSCKRCREYIEEKIKEQWTPPDKAPTIEQVMDSIDAGGTKVSPEFQGMLNSYRIMGEFVEILGNEGKSATEKLDEFIVKYDEPNTKTYLLANTDNFVQRVIKEIVYQLSRITILKPIEGFFTPDQILRKQLAELKAEANKENGPPALSR